MAEETEEMKQSRKQLVGKIIRIINHGPVMREKQLTMNRLFGGELTRITPNYRNNGKYQFVTGYTGGFAAEMCIHLTFDEIKERLQEKYGKDTLLVDNGTDLILSRV